MTAPRPASRLGTPHVHHRLTDSTNERARRLAGGGAPHGTLVTAEAQSAGRGRQGRTWTAPPGSALLCSLVIRDPPRVLPLIGGLATAESVGPEALVKWPNDVLVASRKVAGILVEARPQQSWAVLGVGVNVAVPEEEFSPELQGRAGSLGLGRDAIDPMLERLIERLAHWLAAPPAEMLEALRARDALLGRQVRWDRGAGKAAGIDAAGRLIVVTDAGPVELEAGEVHLG